MCPERREPRRRDVNSKVAASYHAIITARESLDCTVDYDTDSGTTLSTVVDGSTRTGRAPPGPGASHHVCRQKSNATLLNPRTPTVQPTRRQQRQPPGARSSTALLSSSLCLRGAPIIEVDPAAALDHHVDLLLNLLGLRARTACHAGLARGMGGADISRRWAQRGRRRTLYFEARTFLKKSSHSSFEMLPFLSVSTSLNMAPAFTCAQEE